MRQRPAEPRAHLGRREAGGVDAGELRLEVVRLVDDQETAPPESLGVPVAERGEVGGVGAEDRRPEGGRLGADVRALADRAARPAAGAARGRDVRAGIAVARVVVAALHDLELGAELALVLILEQLLRGQQVGVTAPPRERHRDVALAHARRPLDEDHARGRRVVQGLRDRIGDGGEQTRLLGTRRHARREVREKVERVRSPFELGLASHRIMGVWRRSRRGRCCSSRRAGWSSTSVAGCC